MVQQVWATSIKKQLGFDFFKPISKKIQDASNTYIDITLDKPHPLSYFFATQPLKQIFIHFFIIAIDPIIAY